MPSAFESGGKELVHNLTGHIVVDESSRHHEHVGIVMLTNQMGNLRNPAQAGTHLLVLVQRDADTLTTATDGNAGIHLAALDTLSQRMTEIGIVHRCITPRTIVLIGITLLFQILEHEFLKCEACMITGNSYCFNFPSILNKINYGSENSWCSL